MSKTRNALPLGSPLERTRELLDISVTERAAFRTCRRRWELEVLDNLVPKRPTWHFAFGTAIHSVLESYYMRPKSKRPAAAMTEARAELETWLTDMLELDLLPEDERELYELHDLGHEMLDNYVAFDQSNSIDIGTPLAVEGTWLRGRKIDTAQPEGYGDDAEVIVDNGRLHVPIVHPDTKEPTGSYLTARIDLLTERSTPKRGLWIADHKTAARAPSPRGLDFDDQLTGYCYCVWRWTGVVPRGALYNVLIKQAPKEPRMTQKGLSTAKDQLTTPDAYRQALKDNDLMKGNKITSEAHAGCLDALLARGWDPFFQRHEAMRNEAEILNFERRLFIEWQDMNIAKDDPARRYPNPSTRQCPSCSVKQICQAMEDGSDVQSVIEGQFTDGGDRKAAA